MIAEDLAYATADQVERARLIYAVPHTVEIDSVAPVIVGDNGLWVQAWVWLDGEGPNKGAQK